MVVDFINCYFLAGGLGLIYRRNFVEFLVDFQELDYFKNLMSNRSGVRILVFQTGCGIIMSCGFLVEFRDSGTHLRTHNSCHASIFGSGHDKKCFIKFEMAFDQNYDSKS